MKKFLFLFFIGCIAVSAQQRKLIYGKVIDSVDIIKNVNIINLQSNQGTFSNDFGEFIMYAKENDTIKLTSVQYETKLYVVKKSDFGIEKMLIYLTRKTYELDEVTVRKHDLKGSLDLDRKKAKINKKDSLLRRRMDFTNVDMKAKTKDDYIDMRVRPQIVRTDPNLRFVGAGAKITMPFKYSERLWALRRELAFKKSFPALIFNEFGANFFFKELKIPVERYYHFLEYCNPLGIERLYKQGKKLEVIKILQKEHTEYLKIIQKK